MPFMQLQGCPSWTSAPMSSTHQTYSFVLKIWMYSPEAAVVGPCLASLAECSFCLNLGPMEPPRWYQILGWVMLRAKSEVRLIIEAKKAQGCYDAYLCMHISVVNWIQSWKACVFEFFPCAAHSLVSPLFTFFLTPGKVVGANFVLYQSCATCLTLLLSLGSPGVHTGALSFSQFLHTHKVRLLLVSFELYVILMCSPWETA